MAMLVVNDSSLKQATGGLTALVRWLVLRVGGRSKNQVNFRNDLMVMMTAL